MKKHLWLLLFYFYSWTVSGQEVLNDSVLLNRVYDEALKDQTSYDNLRYLTNVIGGRVCGSPQAAAAVEWSEQLLRESGADTVYRQELMVKNWKRGDKEYASVTSTKFGFREVNIAALGGSSPTPPGGIVARVVEVQSFDELAKLGKEAVAGKIVFFNRPMDPVHYYTFEAYGGAAGQRVSGASEAARYGAAGAIVRSLTLSEDEFPHTGSMHYSADDKLSLPVAAICTRDANILSNWLHNDKNLNFYYKLNCKTLPDVQSFNVIAEIQGTDFPGDVITIGGHLDSWDIDPGAHDDGAGCVQAIEVLRIIKKLEIKPKHTIRIVMFMDEEMAQRGALKYSENALAKKEHHIAAIESDRGGLTPVGFSIDAPDFQVEKIKSWKMYFDNYGLHDIGKGGSGVDIGPLKKQNVPLIALVTESQRYFEFHHCANDTFENLNRRELQLGSAAITFLVLLIDRYGL